MRVGSQIVMAADRAATEGKTHTVVPDNGAPDDHLDPRRWFTLSILITTVILIAIDVSVLNVSIPTILKDLGTTVPSLEWVITGYSLTYATFLIIGGRLGDIWGHRRMFVIGAALFGTGSLIASIAPNVGVLILGEAVVEGLGASLMTPATLAILSITFRGTERAKAFAIWGATVGAAVAFGPVLGGFLTTNYSWRWAFRINVIVAPLAIIGARFLMPRGERKPRTPIDIPGAALIASGMFLLVFALSEGGTYGWWKPAGELAVGSVTIWPSSAPVAVAPAALLLALVILASFVALEWSKERRGRHPLFELSQLRFKTFRYGLLTVMILGLGQLGLLFALPLFLQETEHLTAEQNGLWLLPLGLAVVVGAQIGGRLTRRITPTSVARLGLVIETLGYLWILRAIVPDLTFLDLLPGMVVFGIGLGFTSSQITNVILSEVSIEKSGVASGVNTTARQIGQALGAAIFASLITVQTINYAVHALETAPMTPAAQDQMTATVRAFGPNSAVPDNLSPTDAATADAILAQALTNGTRAAVTFGTVMVSIGALLSLLIPRVKPGSDGESAVAIETVPVLDDLEPTVVDGRRA